MAKVTHYKKKSKTKIMNLQIGKLYFFDSSKVSYGELAEINDEGYLFFKPIKNTIYDIENGLIEFRTNQGFTPYVDSNIINNK